MPFEPILSVAVLGIIICSALAYGLGYYRGREGAFREIDEAAAIAYGTGYSRGRASALFKDEGIR